MGLEDSEVVKRFPKIPSMPLSFENADVILRSLGGPMVPRDWRDSGLTRVGPGPTMVNFTYQVGALFCYFVCLVSIIVDLSDSSCCWKKLACPIMEFGV